MTCNGGRFWLKIVGDDRERSRQQSNAKNQTPGTGFQIQEKAPEEGCDHH
jgi:hypothetical protein